MSRRNVFPAPLIHLLITIDIFSTRVFLGAIFLPGIGRVLFRVLKGLFL